MFAFMFFLQYINLHLNTHFEQLNGKHGSKD